MRLIRPAATAWAVVMVMGVCIETAHAGDFWRTAARGLQFAGWVPNTGDVGVYNTLVGDGWNLETTRDLNEWEIYGGAFGFELSTGSGGVPVSFDTMLQLRRSPIPTVRLRVATDQTGTDSATPVAYDFWVNTGFQDVEIVGEGSLEAQIDINAFGFYDIDAFVSNRGTFTIDGIAYADSGTLDYDMGPVSLSGNVFIDILAAVTAPLFEATNTANPLAVFSGRAKLQNQIKERDLLIARLEAGEVLTDEEMNEIITTSMLASVFGGEGSEMLDRVSESVQGASVSSGDEPMMTQTALMPEPISIGLWLVLSAAVLRRRRTPS